MRHVDIAIVGGGLAGSTAAAMLGRAGTSVALIDPHVAYPPDFRCEKLDQSQIGLLQETGLADAVFAAGTYLDELWIARRGRLVQRRRNHQLGIAYETLVNAVRAEVAPKNFIHGKATAIATSADWQTVTLSTGETVTARLVVLANGLNVGLRHTLGIAREVVSPCHSISVGFDVRPIGRTDFDFRALTVYGERIADRIAYLSLFPIGQAMRANLFVYRAMDDLWLRALRHATAETIADAMPGLGRLAGAFEVIGPVKIRPVDLHVTRGHRQEGIVLLGDAFETSCPAAGTGVNKVLTDATRLCNVHIPRWLESAGMGADKIADFYDDPVKRAADAHSAAKARSLRALSTDDGLTWRARRYAKYVAQVGLSLIMTPPEPRPVVAPPLAPEAPARTREQANAPARTGVRG